MKLLVDCSERKRFEFDSLSRRNISHFHHHHSNIKYREFADVIVILQYIALTKDGYGNLYRSCIQNMSSKAGHDGSITISMY